MIRFLSILLLLAPVLPAAEFRHFGDFAVKSHFKITGDRVSPIPLKAVVFRVSTDGVHVRVAVAGDDEARTTFDIYRSDGIGRQRSGQSNLDIIPGIQATSNMRGVIRHLRLTRETLTITTFPGVSDQTIVSHAVAVPTTPPAAPPPATAAKKPTPLPAKP